MTFDDGDFEAGVPLKFVRVKKATGGEAAKRKGPAQVSDGAERADPSSGQPDSSRKKRMIKPTTVMVDGFAVKRQNMYDMEEGEGSVWDRELGVQSQDFAARPRAQPAASAPRAVPKAPKQMGAEEKLRQEITILQKELVRLRNAF